MQLPICIACRLVPLQDMCGSAVSFTSQRSDLQLINCCKSSSGICVPDMALQSVKAKQQTFNASSADYSQ